MAMTPDDLADRLSVVTAAVPGLRGAGVTRLTLGDLVLEIDPPPPEPSRAAARDVDADFLDPRKFRAHDDDEGPGGDL